MIDPEKAVSTFERLVTFVRKNLVAVILTVLIALVGYGGYQTLHNFDKILEVINPSPSVEAKRFHDEAKAGLSIHDALEDTLKRSGADRVSYNIFSNNTKGLSGVPFSFTTIQDIALSPGVSSGGLETGEKMPNSVFSEYYAAMWKDPTNPVCAWFDTSDIKSSLVRARLQNRGTQHVVVCPVIAHDGTPIGAAFAGYLRHDSGDPSREMILSTMGQLASDIGVALENKTFLDKSENPQSK